MAPRAKITGTGMYVPDRVVTNDELSERMDTSDEWIRQRTGIEERCHISEGQRPSDLAREASNRALAAADLSADDIDCVVLATLSPEADFPESGFSWATILLSFSVAHITLCFLMKSALVGRCTPRPHLQTSPNISVPF